MKIGAVSEVEHDSRSSLGQTSVPRLHLRGPLNLDPRTHDSGEYSFWAPRSTLAGVRELLLVQVRDPGDSMEEHEQECVRRRFGDRRVKLRARNVLKHPATKAWLDGVEGVIIGGSGTFSVHHPVSATWVHPLRKLLDLALHQALPGFGVCFGHQLLSVHLGAEVVTDTTRMESGTIALDRVEDDAVFEALPQHFFAHTGHTDLVTSLPPGTT